MLKRLAILGAAAVVAMLGASLAIGHSSSPPPAILDHGNVYGSRWASTVYRSHSGRPCFTVGGEAGDVGLTGTQCGYPTHGEPIQMGVDIGSGHRRGIASLYVAPLGVHRFYVVHNGGCPARWVRLERLGRHKARRAHVHRTFRFKAFARKLCP